METTSKTNGTSNDGNGAAAVSAAVSSAPDSGGRELPQSITAVVQKRRGVQPGAKRGPYKKHRDSSAGPAAAADPVAVRQPASVFTPEDTGLLVELPFNLAMLKTGWTGFCLTPMEKESLSRTGTVVLNQWVTVDPKYVALIIFSLALLKTAGEKTLGYRVALQEHLKQQAATSGARAPAPAAPAEAAEVPAHG